MIVIVLIASIAIGLVKGGSLAQLARAELYGWPYYLTAFALQVVLPSAISHNGDFGDWAYSASFLLLLIGVSLDRRTPGMVWTGIGVLLNAIVIIANGGKMPVFLNREADSWASAQAITHVPVEHSHRLSFLGDFIRFPLTRGHFLLLSPGDVLMAVGVFIAVQRLMHVNSTDRRNTGR